MRDASEYATGSIAPSRMPPITPGTARGASRAPAIAAAKTTR